MADDILSPEIMAEAEKRLASYIALLEDGKKHHTKLSEAAKLAFGEISKGFAAAAQNAEEYLGIGSKFAQLSKYIKENEINIDELNEKIKNNPALVANITTALTTLINIPVPDYFRNFGNSAKIGLESVKTDYDRTLGVVTELIPGIGTKLKKLGDNFAIKIDAARDAENAMLRLQAQSGDLGDTFKKFGNDLSGIDRMMSNFGNQISDVSDRTGAAPDKIRELAQTMGAIPGRLQGMSQFADSTGEKMDNLTAVIKISRGTFHDIDKVMEVVNNQFNKFGTSQDNALKIVSRMQSATEQLGLPLSNIKGFVDSAASSFKFLGDNSQSALTIMGGLAPALKKSGLGPEAITELLSGVTDGIAKLDVAQRAFISSQAGGPGGLQGAAQIQLLQQQDRSDEILNMIKGGLSKQFGNRGAISLQEAAGDQGLAAQRQKQIAFLTQGPFGQLVQGEQGASKLLDAFKAGTADSKALLSAEDATKQAITKGEGEQKRQTTVLETARNTLDRIFQADIQNTYLLARQVVGSDNKKIEEILSRSKDIAAKDLGARTRDERIRATEVGIGRTGEIVGGTGKLPQEATAEAVVRGLSTFKHALDVSSKPGSEEEQITESKKPLSFDQMMKQIISPQSESPELIEQASAMPKRAAPALVHKAAETHAATVAAVTTRGGAAGTKEPVKDYNINVNYRGLDDQLRAIAVAVVKDGRVIVESAANGTGPPK